MEAQVAGNGRIEYASNLLSIPAVLGAKTTCVSLGRAPAPPHLLVGCL